MYAYERARKIAPDFALALHGCGCAEFVLGRQEAIEHLQLALTVAGSGALGELMLINEVRYAAKVGGVDPDTLLADLRAAGTTFQRNYDKLSTSAENWGKTESALRSMSWLPGNQHLANFAGNRQFERLEQMGTDGANRWLQTHHDQQRARPWPT